MLLDSNTFDKLSCSLLSCGVFSKGKSKHLLHLKTKYEDDNISHIYLGGLFPYVYNIARNAIPLLIWMILM